MTWGWPLFLYRRSEGSTASSSTPNKVLAITIPKITVYRKIIIEARVLVFTSVVTRFLISSFLFVSNFFIFCIRFEYVKISLPWRHPSIDSRHRVYNNSLTKSLRGEIFTADLLREISPSTPRHYTIDKNLLPVRNSTQLSRWLDNELAGSRYLRCINSIVTGNISSFRNYVAGTCAIPTRSLRSCMPSPCTTPAKEEIIKISDGDGKIARRYWNRFRHQFVRRLRQ